MPSAIFLLKCDNTLEKTILNEICRVDGVKVAYLTAGYYNIVAIAQAGTAYELKWSITSRIKRIYGIASLVTLLERSPEPLLRVENGN